MDITSVGAIGHRSDFELHHYVSSIFDIAANRPLLYYDVWWSWWVDWRRVGICWCRDVREQIFRIKSLLFQWLHSNSHLKLKSLPFFPLSNFLSFLFPFDNSTDGHLLRILFLCWPPTNSVRQIKDSKQTNDQMNWQHAKNLNVKVKNGNQVISLYIGIAREILHRTMRTDSNVLFPIPMHLIPIRISFPSYGWSYFHSSGDPMWPMESRSFPFPCTSLMLLLLLPLLWQRRVTAADRLVAIHDAIRSSHHYVVYHQPLQPHTAISLLPSPSTLHSV